MRIRTDSLSARISCCILSPLLPTYCYCNILTQGPVSLLSLFLLTPLDDDDVDQQSLTCYEEKWKIHLYDGLHDAILSLRETCENIQVSNEVETDALVRGVEGNAS